MKLNDFRVLTGSLKSLAASTDAMRNNSRLHEPDAIAVVQVRQIIFSSYDLHIVFWRFSPTPSSLAREHVGWRPQSPSTPASRCRAPGHCPTAADWHMLQACPHRGRLFFPKKPCLCMIARGSFTSWQLAAGENAPGRHGPEFQKSSDKQALFVLACACRITVTDQIHAQSVSGSLCQLIDVTYFCSGCSSAW